jgi:hypothetical protein
LEVIVATGVLLVGVLGFAQAIVAANISAQRTREADRATQAIREVLERIDAEAFADAFRRFNGDSSDDPGGAGTAPGAGFEVKGLQALADDVDGLPGEVIFPTASGSTAELREDQPSSELGMPRDLNGDGLLDAFNHAVDYKILPVIVRVRWRTATGPAQVDLKTLLANY